MCVFVSRGNFPIIHIGPCCLSFVFPKHMVDDSLKSSRAIFKPCGRRRFCRSPRNFLTYVYSRYASSSSTWKCPSLRLNLLKSQFTVQPVQSLFYILDRVLTSHRQCVKSTKFCSSSLNSIFLRDEHIIRCPR